MKATNNFQFLLIFAIAAVLAGELFVLLGEKKAPALERVFLYTLDNITIEKIDHQRRNQTSKEPFSRYEGEVFGLNAHNDFSALEFFMPFSRTRGIASGDFNNDGWQDILLGTNNGILLYKNVGGRFVLQDVTLGGIPSLALGVHVVAFVDINNDGWQDLYLTTYGGRNYIALNRKGAFKTPKVLEVPNTGAMVTLAASFGDVDQNGDLDLAQGNWATSFFRSESGAETNKLIVNKNPGFVERDLQGFQGQTLSVLFADFTNDDILDLIDGNEFDAPDNFFVGDGVGGFREIKRSDEIIPASAHFTMGIDVADFDNDLRMDIYASGQSTLASSTEDPCGDIQNIKERRQCERNLEVIDAVRKRNIEECAVFVDDRDKDICTVMITLRLVMNRGEDMNLCDKIPKDYALPRSACFWGFASRDFRSEDYAEAVEQLPRQNVLLQGSADGSYKEVSKERGVANALNSWNAKFADIDNDEWQDIYVGTGELVEARGVFQANVFLHNQEGQYFKQAQKEFGLEHFGATNSYVYIDIDNDGDLDIITVDLNGPLNVYLNNEDTNNSVVFEFRDYKGNYFGIGNKMYIYYGGDNKRHQVRQIKLGGGYSSFEAPIAHFGLGGYDRVNRVEIFWSTGEKTTLDKEFLANKHYVISRKR